jgi:signal transduction histidine kinase
VSADLTCHVACAAGVLTSVVSNLASNAIKYIGTGPVRRLEIRAREEAQVVRVELEDTGPGLAVGSEEQVFEPYVRGRATTQPGIGLGLATVKRLVEGHGGRVGVRSVLGQGCTFWFELPKVAGASLDA